MKEERKFSEIVKINQEIIEEFKKREKRKWGIEGAVMEMGKQYGDLCKWIMSKENYYLKERNIDPNYIADKEKIKDELADIWLCMIKIADYYKIDIKNAIIEARERDQKWFKKHPKIR